MTKTQSILKMVYILMGRKMSANDIATRLRIHPRTAKRYLAEIRESKFMLCKHGGKGNTAARYEVMRIEF